MKNITAKWLKQDISHVCIIQGYLELWLQYIIMIYYVSIIYIFKTSKVRWTQKE